MVFTLSVHIAHLHDKFQRGKMLHLIVVGYWQNAINRCVFSVTCIIIIDQQPMIDIRSSR